MSELSTAKRKQAWDRATPLSVSIYNFGRPETVKKLNRSKSERPFHKSMPHLFAKMVQSEDSLLSPDEIAEADKGLDALSLQSQLRTELEDEISKKLRSGTLLGLGFDEPRKSADLPVYIPIDVWSGVIQWHKDMVVGNGARFVAVRIVAPDSAETPQVGRPSSRHLIEAAFWDLIRQGRFDLTTSTASQFNIVREQIWASNPQLERSPKGFGNKTMQATLGPLASEALKKVGQKKL